MSTALEHQTKGSLAVVPDHLKKYVGMEDTEHEVGREDLLIPRLAVAQDGMSPQLKKQNELYIEGLEAGDLFNTVTLEVYGSAVRVVPLFFNKTYIEFAPNMGGVVAQYKSEADVPAGALDWVTDEKGNKGQRVTTFKNRMCLIETKGGWQPIIVSFKKGEVKFSDQWNSQIKFARANDGLPCFGHTYTITSKLKNKGQQSWFVKTVQMDGFTPAALFEQAKSYFDQLRDGGYTVDTTGIEAERKEDEGDTSFDQ